MNRKPPLPDFVREAIAQESTLSADETKVGEVLALVASALPTDVPPVSLRQRLLSTATSGSWRFAPFVDDLARLFDLAADAVEKILERASSESTWEAGPHPAIRVFHLEPGASLATADAGFVQMPAGFAWPAHRHSAPERVLILEGGYRDSSGKVYRAGDVHEMGDGTEHSFTVLPEGPLTFALVLHGPFEML